MKGILFKPDMIKAIREGEKTQTRRVIKPCSKADVVGRNEKGELDNSVPRVQPDWVFTEAKSRYRVGEPVYIKEAWCYKVDPITAEVLLHEFWYRAENPEVEKVDGDGCPEQNKDGSMKSPWISPLFMPARSARTFIQIVSVRPERLQAISPEDCVDEGIEKIEYGWQGVAGHNKGKPWASPISAYADLWDSINPKYPWISNLWVWRYEFKLNETLFNHS